MRLGLIVPSTNTVAEQDFQANVPPGMSVHSARMFIEETTAESERRMIEEYLPSAARDIAGVRPDVVVFGCTSAGAVVGQEGEDKIMRDLRAWSGCPVVSTNSAVHHALERVGAQQVVIVTAYIDDLTRRIVEGVERQGYNVVAAAGLGIVDPFEIAEVEPERIAAFAEETAHGHEFDTLFVSCTNLRGFEARADISQRLHVSVITSNQAALEQALLRVRAKATNS